VTVVSVKRHVGNVSVMECMDDGHCEELRTAFVSQSVVTTPS
jgi:hypothetical protein